MHSESLILGAGMTGLSAGFSSGLPVYEAEASPGGICSSYHKDSYRFEIGGGHWIFGGSTEVRRLIEELAPAKSYRRKASVYLYEQKLKVPYPLQNHLRELGPDLAQKCLAEITQSAENDRPAKTMSEWLLKSFGRTLCDLFFDSFHRLYTAGLSSRIAPQDVYKSPVDINLVRQGASGAGAPSVGYNTTFIYPKEGLNVLAQRLSEKSKIHYGKRAVGIDLKKKTVSFEDGSGLRYETILSTLPLNVMVRLSGLSIDEEPFPSPSVLVINVGAEKGNRCPDDHWVYFSKSKSGFHRVGFYSNVDRSFLPKNRHNRVGIYVERAYPEKKKPLPEETAEFSRNAIGELQELEWIEDADIVDPTWIQTAYTWAWPGSSWKEKALTGLREHGIHQIGRYGRWVFQGIAESISEGLAAGTAFKKSACESLTS